MGFGEFTGGFRRVVVDPFWCAARDVVEHFHGAVGGDDVGAGGYELEVCLKLVGDVRLGVIAIENDEDAVVGHEQ